MTRLLRRTRDFSNESSRKHAFVTTNQEALHSRNSEERSAERDFSPAVIPSGARNLSSSSMYAWRRLFAAHAIDQSKRNIRGSTHHASERRRSRSVKFFRHAPGEKCLAARDRRIAHCFRHQHRICSFRNRRIHQDSVGAKFHRHRRIGCGSNARIHDHRDFGNAFAQNSQRRRILNAQSGSDWRSQRHHRGCASINQFSRRDQIIIGIRKNNKSFLHQNARRFNQLFGIRIKRLLVTNHFEFYPVGKTAFPPQPRSANRFFRGVTRGGIRQDKHFVARNKDRKSTRLNSSHSQISYAVFCLKKKKKIKYEFFFYKKTKKYKKKI